MSNGKSESKPIPVPGSAAGSQIGEVVSSAAKKKVAGEESEEESEVLEESPALASVPAGRWQKRREEVRQFSPKIFVSTRSKNYFIDLYGT